MKFLDLVRRHQNALLLVIAPYLMVACVEKHNTKPLSLSPKKASSLDSDKLDLEAFERGFVGSWAQKCGPADSQKVTWSFDGFKFSQKVEIFLERGCPSNSIAATYSAKGSYYLGDMINGSADAAELDYVQEEYSLTIHHKAYLDAYNATGEYAHLHPYCKGETFKIGQELSLIGKECLEGDNTYQIIHPNQVYYSSIKMNGETLSEAQFSYSNDGSSPDKRALVKSGAPSYSKVLAQLSVSVK